jgi:hypothetical protein
MKDVAPNDYQMRVDGSALAFLSGEEIVCIVGAPHLDERLNATLLQSGCDSTACVLAEPDPSYTQRESELLTTYVQRYGHLPPRNGLEDDLFDDEDV